MGKEYIDREVVKNELTRVYDMLSGYHPSYYAGYMFAKFTALNIPAADVIPVVRCEHCQSYDHGYCNLLKIPMDPQDFCSYGRRKNDGEENR